MQEQNLPAPVMPDNPGPQNPETTMSPSGEVMSAPVAPSPEKVTAAGDRVNQSSPQQSILPTDLPQPIMTSATAATTDDNGATSSQSNPVVADEVDVIEKAWVQKAKSIVGETKSDPYQQEEKVSKLQTDYQLKRFGETATDK